MRSAGAGVSAGVGAAVGSALNGVDFKVGNFGNQLVRGTLSGLAAGTTAAVMRGGRVSVQQIATDAFGNTLGSSLADGSFNGASQNEAVLQGAGPWSSRDYVNGMDLQSDRYHASVSNAALQGGNAMWDDAAPPTMAERYAQTYGGQAYDAADKFSMSNVRGRLSSDDNIINAAQMREMNQMQRNMAELNALSAQISTDRQLGNIEELGKAYGAAGYGPGDPYALPGGAAPSADRWIPGGPLPQDGGTVVGKRMSQAEMDAFDSQSGNYNSGSGLKLPGTSGMDEFGRGWSSRGSDWSVLEGDKPLSYSLGSGMRTSLGLVYDGLTGAESFNQAGRAWRAGNYGTAALYGMQGVGTAGLTAMTLGDYALAKAGVMGVAGNTGLKGGRYSGDVFATDFVGPRKFEVFYRGDEVMRSEFLSSMAQKEGLSKAESFLSRLDKPSLDTRMKIHSITSEGSALISTTKDRRVAEYFARGENQTQQGFVTEFRVPAGNQANAFKYNEFSEFNQRTNIKIGLSEQEFVVRSRIDPRYIHSQNLVSPK